MGYSRALLLTTRAVSASTTAVLTLDVPISMPRRWVKGCTFGE
jgi:hypothetical protein